MLPIRIVTMSRMPVLMFLCGLLTSSLLPGSSLLWSLHPEPVVGGVSPFGAIGYAAACIMGLSLFRDIRYFQHPPEDR
jgi:hypothetical protein